MSELKQSETTTMKPAEQWAMGSHVDGTHEFNILMIKEIQCDARAELERENQRLLDLVRHQRAELHQADLINDDEYAALASITGSPARLRSYDDVSEERDQWKRCASDLSDAATMAAGYISASGGKDGKTFPLLVSAVAAFDKLNTP